MRRCGSWQEVSDGNQDYRDVIYTLHGGTRSACEHYQGNGEHNRRGEAVSECCLGYQPMQANLIR